MIGKTSTKCSAALKPNKAATEPRKAFNDGARFSNIHDPAPARTANPIKIVTHKASGVQACLSDSEGIIVLETVKVR